MALSQPNTSQFIIYSSPPAAPGDGSIPANKVPLNLSDFDLPLHLNIRNFRAPVKTLPLTLVDLDYHSVEYWEEVSTAELTEIDSEIVGNEEWSTYGLTQTQLDLLTQTQLDVMTQRQIESSAGIGEVPAWAYNPGINISVPTTGILLTSQYNDNLMVPPFDEPGTYYIEFILRDLPAQLASPKLNIDESYISFSSSDDNEASVTDVIPFSDSITSLEAGGNVTWRINRDSLVNSDPSNIKRIDLFLKAEGGTLNFKAEAMRLVPSTYPYYTIGIDTKSGVLRKNPSVNGTNISAQPTPPPILNIGSNRAKNFTEVVRFNPGHHPVAPAVNSFSLFLRAAEGSGQYIEAVLELNDEETTVKIYEGGIGIRQMTLDAPLDETLDHLLLVDLDDNSVRAQIWALRGHYRTELLLDTLQEGFANVSLVEPGFVGYTMSPATADFYVDYTFARDAALAEFETNTFYSVTPVRGVTLYTQSAGPVEILDQESIAEGPAVNRLNLLKQDSGADNGDFIITPGVNDVTASLDLDISNSNDGSYRVRKHVRNAFIGGLKWNTPVKINDPLNARIRADIRFDTPLNYGSFRFVLFDKWFENVAFVSKVDVGSLILNKWNEIDIPILNEEIFHNEFRMQIHHLGVDTSKSSTDPAAVGNFWIDNVRIETDSVVWEASNDGGLNYLRFFDTLDSQYQGVAFRANNNQLKIRARAFTTKAWVNSFETVVHYAQPGRIVE